LSQRSSDHCDTVCSASQKNDVDTKFLVADVSAGVGVVALVLAAWTFFSRPSVSPQQGAAIDVQSTAGGVLATFGERF
jgi:hypothetical protein